MFEYEYSPEKHALLAVHDDSMINAGIKAGSHCVIEFCDDFSSGDIAVVLVRDKMFLRRFYKCVDGTCWFKAENSHFKPMVLTDDKFLPIGRVVEIRTRV